MRNFSVRRRIEPTGQGHRFLAIICLSLGLGDPALAFNYGPIVGSKPTLSVTVQSKDPGGAAAIAQQASQPSPIGDWKLTAIYDKFEDGRLRNTWGDKPEGLLQVSAGGFLSLQVFGRDRPKFETVPTDPVGPVRCSYGTYTLDLADKTLKFVVQQDTYPQFIGVTRNLKIEELTPTTLKFSVAPIHDPKGGDFTPHLEFQRLQ